jgi:hypothetical protein
LRLIRRVYCGFSTTPGQPTDGKMLDSLQFSRCLAPSAWAQTLRHPFF